VSEESGRTNRDVVIAGLIALAVAMALLLDTRIESQALESGRTARADVAQVAAQPESRMTLNEEVKR
jgi:hypothetical protein